MQYSIHEYRKINKEISLSKYRININLARLKQIKVLIILLSMLLPKPTHGGDIEINKDILIKISKHGELRDVPFIENIIGTKFNIYRNDLRFIEFSGTNALLSMRLTSNESATLVNSGFEYDIAVDPYAGPIRFTVPFVIAGIQFSDIDRILCTNPDDMQLSLGGAKRVLLPKPSPPPLMSKSQPTNSQSIPWPIFMDRYEFLVISTDRYRTSIIIDAPINGLKCSRSVSIIQTSLK